MLDFGRISGEIAQLIQKLSVSFDPILKADLHEVVDLDAFEKAVIQVPLEFPVDALVRVFRTHSAYFHGRAVDGTIQFGDLDAAGRFERRDAGRFRHDSAWFGRGMWFAFGFWVFLDCRHFGHFEFRRSTVGVVGRA